MGSRLTVALALLAVAAVSAQPEQGVLRIKVTLANAAQVPTPVRRHALLISDNPPSADPRQIFTAADGTVVLMLRPGSYIVESDLPVSFGGRAYVWTQVVEIVAGRDLSLDLTIDNAEIVPLETLPSPTADSTSAKTFCCEQYQESIVAVWSPTARASGFVVDTSGLIATDGRAVGTATVVEVQLAPAVKVPASVLLSERSRDVAIVRVDPGVVATRPPLALACPPSRAPSLDDRQAIVSITAPHAGEKELVRGEVTALQPRRVQTDVRLPFGGSGGPVFNDAGAVVGLTSMAVDPDSRPDDAASYQPSSSAKLWRHLCLVVGRGTAGGDPAPRRPHTAVSCRHARRSPAEARRRTRLFRSCRRRISMWRSSRRRWCIARGSAPAGRAAQRGRSPETEARIGRLTEFGAWSDYFSDLPAVLIVRATPKMVEGFWKRLGREAAATQGAVLPPFKDFKSSFRHMRATCAGVEVTPIHPFVLEHRVNGEERHP